MASDSAQAEADKIAEMQDDGPSPEDQLQQSAAEDVENNEGIDAFEVAATDADTLPQPTATNSEIGALFAPFTFYLSRETPRQPLEFILKAFGCKRVGWDATLGDGAFTTDESDPNITHQIVDRPSLGTAALPPIPAPAGEDAGETASRSLWPRATVPGRTYVQPQWVWDCVNQMKLLRPDLYGPGVTLPPHLSPWVKPKKGQYDPTLTLEEQEREGEAEEHEDDAPSGDEEPTNGVHGKKLKSITNGHSAVLDLSENVDAGEGMDVADDDSEADSDSEDDESMAEEDLDVASDASSDMDEEESARQQHQRELEAEAAGLAPESVRAVPLSNAEKARKKRAKAQKSDQEELDRQMMMMSRKKRKLMDKMIYSNRKKDEEAEKLRAKRRKLEKKKTT